MLRFRCHTGHAYTAQSLIAELSDSIEDALWNTLRAIEESVMLLQHMSGHLRAAQDLRTAEHFTQQAKAAEQRADLVRQAVMQHNTPSQTTPEHSLLHIASGISPP